ncbi:MAG: hypothetical protein KDG55_02450 [Rhodocyclaceae bacterium]|nr:hypothetical protein [Rhodocyclaceae bacterium]
MRIPMLLGVAMLAIGLSQPMFAQDSFGGQGGRQAPGTYPQGPQPLQGQMAPPQGYPQPPQGGYAQPPQGGYAQAPQGGYAPPQAGDLDQLSQMERQDFGVPPTRTLHNGQMHGPTPANIPGGQVITTKGLVGLVQSQQSPYLLIDVLGGPQTLPGALPAAWASQPGTLNDQVQQQFASMLQQATQGRKDLPLILYCLSTQCWMSYNAALRAIGAGYTNVLWYRGGIEAWQAAGLPLAGAQMGGYPQQSGAYPAQPGAYPRQPGAYPQPQGGYMQPGSYPQQSGGMMPPGGYPQQGGAMPPGGYPPPGAYPPPQGTYPGGTPPQQGGYR